MYRKSFLFCLIFLLSIEANAQWKIMSKEADSLVTIGSDYIYNLEYEKAEQVFKQIQKMEPHNPAGYFLDAMIQYWQILIFPNSEKTDEIFKTKIDKVLILCDSLLKQDEYNLAALFFKGGALGFRARYFTDRGKYFDAVSDGKEAFEIMTQCYKKAPNNHDIMLGTGIYNYFAEAIPEKMPILKPVVLFFPKGSKKLGILQLKASALHGRYTKIEALNILVQIYSQSFEANPNEALYYSKQLFKKYPQNPYFQRNYGRSLVQMGEWDTLEVIWRDYVIRTQKKMRGYDNYTAREGCYYIGLALERKADYEGALKYLLKCEEISQYLKDEKSGYRSSANMKIALIYDKLGKRDLAIKHYKICLNVTDFQDNHARAQKYLKTPYR